MGLLRLTKSMARMFIISGNVHKLLHNNNNNMRTSVLEHRDSPDDIKIILLIKILLSWINKAPKLDMTVNTLKTTWVTQWQPEDRPKRLTMTIWHHCNKLSNHKECERTGIWVVYCYLIYYQPNYCNSYQTVLCVITRHEIQELLLNTQKAWKLILSNDKVPRFLTTTGCIHAQQFMELLPWHSQTHHCSLTSTSGNSRLCCTQSCVTGTETLP